VSRDVNADVGL